MLHLGFERAHILPQIVGPIIAIAISEMARIILLESSLSYLGLGVQPPNMSWGLILSDESVLKHSLVGVNLFGCSNNADCSSY